MYMMTDEQSKAFFRATSALADYNMNIPARAIDPRDDQAVQDMFKDVRLYLDALRMMATKAELPAPEDFIAALDVALEAIPDASAMVGDAAIEALREKLTAIRADMMASTNMEAPAESVEPAAEVPAMLDAPTETPVTA